MVQFQGVQATEHVWSLVRSGEHVDRILAAVESYPGPVLYTVIDKTLCRRLEEGCQRLQVPCVPILEQVMHTLGDYLGLESQGRPGRQHRLDAAYFERIEAMDYTLTHDDGQLLDSLDQADIILLGVSRTSKTPTALYLANRGYKVANVPLVSGMDLAPQVRAVRGCLVIGLTNDPVRLTQLRRNRMLMLRQDQQTGYVDLEAVRREVTGARRLFHAQGWPVIDVTRRSIEETAAGILQHYARFHGREG